jgi:RNA polymerase-binding protein DksA
MAGRKPTAADLKRYRDMLLMLRRELAGDIDHLEADAFLNDGERASADNPADIGSDSFAQEFSLELLQRDGETLDAVEEALKRLEAGDFGRCEECESWILKARLEAIPFARNCIECQRAQELGG